MTRQQETKLYSGKVRCRVAVVASDGVSAMLFDDLGQGQDQRKKEGPKPPAALLQDLAALASSKSQRGLTHQNSKEHPFKATQIMSTSGTLAAAPGALNSNPMTASFTAGQSPLYPIRGDAGQPALPPPPPVAGKGMSRRASVIMGQVEGPEAGRSFVQAQSAIQPCVNPSPVYHVQPLCTDAFFTVAALLCAIPPHAG